LIDDWKPAPADPGIEGEDDMETPFDRPQHNKAMDRDYAEKLCAVGQPSRMPIRARIEDRAQRLRDEAFRLDHLARELPHLSPEAEDAFFQMIARGNL
jgi:hypothetical protein